jgi:flagellar motor switch protein FliG
MDANDQGIRKAAQLVASLEVDTADRLLDKLPEPVARRIRELAVELDEVADADRQGLLEALRGGASRQPDVAVAPGDLPLSRAPALTPATPPAPASRAASAESSPTRVAESSDGGVVFHGRLAEMVGEGCDPRSQLRPWSPPRDGVPSGQRESGPAEPPPHVAEDGPPLASLHDVECASLAEALADERPQTIAVVLAHLPPGRAAEVLDRLDPGLCEDVVQRLSRLEETDPTILRELGVALQSRLAARLDIGPKRMVGGDALQGILGKCAGPLAERIRATLASGSPTKQADAPPARPNHASEPATSHTEQLASVPSATARIHDTQPLRSETIAVERRQRSAKPMERPVAFDQIVRLSDVALARLAARVDDRVLLLTMLSATPEWCARVLRVLPPLEADRMARKLKRPGPIRLSDLDEARRRLGRLAAELDRQGIIQVREQPTRLQRAV